MPVNTMPLLVKVKFGSEGRNGRNLTQPPPMVGQTCRFAPISPPASAAMLAEPWGYACQNIAPLVLVEDWAARPLTFHFSATRQRRPTLVVSSCARFERTKKNGSTKGAAALL